MFGCFECVVLGTIEFVLSISIAFAGLARIRGHAASKFLPFLEREFHFITTYWGKAVIFLLFGVLGLSGDLIRNVFSVAVVAFFLYLFLSCFNRSTKNAALVSAPTLMPPTKPGGDSDVSVASHVNVDVRLQPPVVNLAPGAAPAISVVSNPVNAVTLKAVTAASEHRSLQDKW